MPALITHNVFGQMVCEKNFSSLFTTQDEKDAFSIGNQGPDPMFFRCRATPSQIKLAHQVASDLHSEKMSKTLNALRQALKKLPEEDYSVGLAYVLGYLSHYILDKTVHPYIYSTQYAIQEMDEELAESSGAVHGVIESDLDSILMLRFFGLQISQVQPKDYVPNSDRVKRVVGALMNYAIVHGLGIDFPATEVANSIDDMKWIYTTIEPLGSTMSHVVRVLEGTSSGKYSQIQSLCHRRADSADSTLLNLDHYKWEDPNTHQQRTESFIDLFENGIEAYGKAYKAYLEGEPCETITEHITFDGAHLTEEELRGVEVEF